ncbi:MAG TPA: hypothetical protein VHK90_13310, partial [Thermoanaerobaculia bacterium]|nr:hypothetical protein [Thermoanaerobaculia bacterium]
GGGAASLDVSVSGPATPSFTHAGNPGLFAELFQERIAAEGNRFSQNSIYDNGGMGIALSCCCRDLNDGGDADIGPNTFLNYPLFTSRTVNPDGSIVLNGTATPNATVEIFGSTNDGFGYGGEGKLYAGSVTADGTGNFTTTIALPQPYYSVTSTATDLVGNTSEFSDNFNVRPRQIVVTTAIAGGPGSLVEALGQANSDGVPTLITFDPSLFGASIGPIPLVTLSEGFTTINGDINNDCAPDVEIRGDGTQFGLDIASPGNVVRGLALNRFVSEMLELNGPDAQNNEIRCNHLGLDLAGTTAFVTGMHGIAVRNGASGNVIANNRIAGVQAACLIQNGHDLDLVSNVIGWPVNMTPLGDGIAVEDGSANVRIGDGTPGGANTIAGNGGAGIRIHGTSGVAIRNNAFANNGGLAIDLEANGVTANDGGDGDSGANGLLNFPVLTRASASGASTQVEGFLDTAPGTYDIELYVSSERDPSGYGEGATRVLGAQVQPGSFFFWLPPLPPGAWLTAIVIDAAHNTSEFSLAKEITGTPLAATELVAYPVAAGIELRWRDPQASETGFRIERFAFSSWTIVTTVGPDVTTWIDTNVPPGTTRSWRVVALSAAGDAPPSNVATATSPSTFPLEICRGPATWLHPRAESPSVAFDGTRGAVAYASASGGRAADIYFQRLDEDGSPAGAPVRITNDDVPSTRPTLTWNGTHYGLLWLDHLRAADGRPVAQLSFALLGPAGAAIRTGVRITSANGGVPFVDDSEVPLIWDGGGWGIFVTEEGAGGFPHGRFYRLDEDGDVLVNGALLPFSGNYASSISAAWNGIEYGVAWRRSPVPFQNAAVFTRVQTNGAFASVVFLGGHTDPPASGTSVAWDGSAWAVAWTLDHLFGTTSIRLRRLDAAGNPLGPDVRLSDDGNAFDDTPKLVLKPGGGFIVYTTTTLPSGVREIGRLEADANGQRTGSWTIVSPDDGYDSLHPRATYDGAGFLLAWSESRVHAHEIATAIVSTSSVPGTVHAVTTGHGGTTASRWPSVVASQNGFLVAWTETSRNDARIDARIYRQNGVIVERPSLNAGRPYGAVQVRKTNDVESAIVWNDRQTGGVHFDRFETNTGNPLLGGGVRIADADGGRGVAFDFDGEQWGVLWVHGGALKFQRMGFQTPIGLVTAVAAEPQSDPRIAWIGNGWAILWKQWGTLWFARLDPAGALVVPPAVVTYDTLGVDDFTLQWTGRHLAVVWSEYRGASDGTIVDLFFTTLDANGFKQIAPVTVANTRYPDRDAALSFDGTNFRIVYPDVATGLREITIAPEGTIVGTRFLGNHGEGRVAVAHNGATMAMAWEHMGELFVQTTECLADASAPLCPSLNATFADGAVQLTWPMVSDPESGTIAYHLYRDGRLLTELRPVTTSFADHGFTPGATHTYELRPYNG